MKDAVGAELLDALKLASERHAAGHADGSAALRRLARRVAGVAGGDSALHDACRRIEQADPSELTQAVEAVAAEIRRRLAQAPAAASEVLVVEDDARLAHLVERSLGRVFRSVRVVPTAAEARRRMRERRPALVVLDLLLPDEDGRDLLADWAELSPAPRVIVVSAAVCPAIRSECLALGAVELFEKPLDLDVLRTVATPFAREEGARAPEARDEVLVAVERARAHGPWAFVVLRAGAGRGASAPAAQRALDVARDALQRVLPADSTVVEQGAGGLAAVVPGAVGHAALEAILLAAAGRAAANHVVVSVGAAISALERLPEVARVAHRMVDLAEDSGGPVRVADLDGALRARVLVADDDPVVARVLVRLLRNLGLEVDHATDGSAALAAAARLDYGLVVLDVQMPGRSGIEVLRRLRGDPRYARTPIALCTSLGSDEDIIAGFEAGADDYLVKPLGGRMFQVRIRALLARGAPPPS